MLNLLSTNQSSFKVFSRYLDVCYARATADEIYCDYTTCFTARDNAGLTFRVIDNLVHDLPFRDIYNSLKDKSKQNIVDALMLFNSNYKPIVADIKKALVTRIISTDLLFDFSLFLDSRNIFTTFHYKPKNDLGSELIDVAWPGLYYRLVPESKVTDLVTAFYLATDLYRSIDFKIITQNNQRLEFSEDIKSLSKNCLLGLPEKITIDNIVNFSRTGLNGIPKVDCSSNRGVTQHLLKQA